MENCTYDELADIGVTCPNAKEIDQALSQYVTKSVRGDIKIKLNDKLK